MRAALERQEREEQQLRGDVTEMRNQWLTPLNDLIARINTNFSRFFAAMDCSGEVDLSVPEDQVSCACRWEGGVPLLLPPLAIHALVN